MDAWLTVSQPVAESFCKWSNALEWLLPDGPDSVILVLYYWGICLEIYMVVWYYCGMAF